MLISFMPISAVFLNTFIYLFIFGCAESSLLCRLFSSCGELELLFAVVRRLLIIVASFVVAPQHVKSSQTRDRTHAPCTSRQMLIRCTTREVLRCLFLTVLHWARLRIQSNIHSLLHPERCMLLRSQNPQQCYHSDLDLPCLRSNSCDYPGPQNIYSCLFQWKLEFGGLDH